jgi:hypothetical protein
MTSLKVARLQTLCQGRQSIPKSRGDGLQTRKVRRYATRNFGILKRHANVLEALTKFYFIVESEILKNTQRNIFHIFTSEDIDHVTYSNLLLSVKFHNLFAWDYTGCIKKN